MNANHNANSNSNSTNNFTGNSMNNYIPPRRPRFQGKFPIGEKTVGFLKNNSETLKEPTYVWQYQRSYQKTELKKK